MAEAVISIEGLTKRYGAHTAVKDVSFRVDEGEIVGFLGPNGAGKTTTMNILTGYISATNGTVKIGGHDIVDAPERAKRQIGYMPDNPPLYGDMLVNEYLRFVCDIKGVKTGERKAMVRKIMETVKIVEIRKRLIKNLSKGYRQRVGLAQALIGFPKVLVLDEPTVGLDPKQIIEMRDVIKALGKKHTIILSSHILPEVSAVCDRVLIINRGSLVAGGTPEELSRGLSKNKGMTARIKGEKDNIAKALGSVAALKKITPLSSREPGTFDFDISGDEGADVREYIFACLARENLPLLMLKPNDLSLEDIFLQITGSGTRGEFER